jgi:hypothetical protein
MPTGHLDQKLEPSTAHMAWPPSGAIVAAGRRGPCPDTPGKGIRRPVVRAGRTGWRALTTTNTKDVLDGERYGRAHAPIRLQCASVCVCASQRSLAWRRLPEGPAAGPLRHQDTSRGQCAAVAGVRARSAGS